jgi:nitrate reductase assembly molybdenum cofactor insertion protein NarJ
MDVETTAAIEQLGDRIDGLEGSMRVQFAEVREQFAGVRAEFVSVRAEMAQMRNELCAEFGEGLAELRDGLAELREGLAENRTQSQLLFESLRDDVRLVAEGVATISAKLDSGRR